MNGLRYCEVTSWKLTPPILLMGNTSRKGQATKVAQTVVRLQNIDALKQDNIFRPTAGERPPSPKWKAVKCNYS